MFPIGLKMTVYGRNIFAIMRLECIYNITVQIYICVLAEYNTLYKFVKKMSELDLSGTEYGPVAGFF